MSSAPIKKAWWNKFMVAANLEYCNVTIRSLTSLQMDAATWHRLVSEVTRLIFAECWRISSSLNAPITYSNHISKILNRFIESTLALSFMNNPRWLTPSKYCVTELWCAVVVWTFCCRAWILQLKLSSLKVLTAYELKSWACTFRKIVRDIISTDINVP